MVGIEIRGFKEIAESARSAIEILRYWNAKATKENVSMLAKKSSKRAKYKTGALRRDIADVNNQDIRREGDTVVGTYGSNLPYSRIIELGGTIKAHTVKVKTRKVLADGKGNFFGKSANIPARYVAPSPYLFPVLVENIEEALDKYRDYYKKASDEIERK